MTPLVAGLAVAAVVAVRARTRRHARRRLAPTPQALAGRPAGLLIGGGAGVAALLVGAGPAAGLGSAVGLAGLRLHRRRAVSRRSALVNADAVTLCFALAGALRAGRTIAEALLDSAAALDRIGPVVAAAGRAVGRGAPVDAELGAAALVVGCDRLRVVAAVLVVGASTGARVADVLDRVGAGLAAADESAAELSALAAGPHATALVLCLLPALAIALGTAMGQAPLRVLLRTPLGWLLLTLGALLDATGLVWVHRITRSALAS